METYRPSLAPSFRALLEQRAATLRQLLRHETDGLAGEHEVQDFKDVASGDSNAVIDEAQSAQAAVELEQIGEALRRIADGSYGLCIDCGDPIDLRRLAAMPATSVCTSCQSARELRRRNV